MTTRTTNRHDVLRARLRRRDVLRGFGGAAGALALAGGARGLLPSGASAQDKTTIVFWTPGGSPTYCDAHTQIAADYTASQPNVTVNFQCGTNGDTAMERLLGAIAAGNPPDGTVVWDTPVSLGVQGAVEPLDDYMKTAKYAGVDNWPPDVLASCQIDGKTWGLPVTAGTYGIWYNQELFESKGIPSDPDSFPKTWDDFRKLSKEFTHWDGDRLVSAGWVFPTPIDFAPTLPIWSALNGGQLYDAANQKYTIDAESNVAMLDYFVSWLDEEYKGDFSQVQRTGSWEGYPSPDGQPPQFQAGNQGFIEEGSWYMGDFYAYGEPAFTKWNVASYPVGPGGSKTNSGYWPNWLVIPKGAHHPDEAFGYLDYMSGVGVVKWFEAVPDLPANKQVPVTVPQAVLDTRGKEFGDAASEFFRKQFDVVTPMWNSPVQSFAQDQLRTTLEAVLNKTAKPKDALAQAQQACQAQLEKTLNGGS
ncbi:MAG TPA: extracellular solute-binding protein [Thermomicrobiales bacterium]|nr:extracellular solute-binding protein [Thermomicrobiales bacterium]